MNNLVIPFRANMGVQTTPPFVNTYSLDFDGVDDYVIAPLDGTTTGGILPANSSDVDLTVSIWFNKTTNTSMFQWADRLTSGIPFILIAGTASGYRILINNAYQFDAIISSGTWVNVVIVRNSATNVWTHYLNGVAIQTYNDGGTLARRLNATDIYLGNGYSSYFNGLIDEVSIFNTDQSSNITTLSTAPTVDLTSLNPIAWYRMGDNGSYKSPQWLLPNNENKDKVSNYSFEFDGVDDYVDCGNGALDITGSITLSCWVKSTNTGSNRKIIVKDDAGSNRSFQININHPSLGPYTYFWLGGGNIKSVFTSIPNQIVDGNWHHVVSVFKSGQYIRMYIDGVQAANTNVTETTLDSANTNFLISTDGYGGTAGIDGNVDSVSVWDSALEAVEIANIYNSGTPTNLSLLSTPPIAWYKMGEDATFSTNWTVPDAIGINNGTSNAMTIEDRVGEAPSSDNNALSYNMDLVDRTTDVPT